MGLDVHCHRNDKPMRDSDPRVRSYNSTARQLLIYTYLTPMPLGETMHTPTVGLLDDLPRPAVTVGLYVGLVPQTTTLVHR